MRDWRNPEFEWDDRNEDHILRHDLYPDEVEEIFDRPYVRRRGSRYLVFGRDGNGRYLTIVCEIRSVAHRRIRVVTARPMTPTERRDYDQHR